MIIFDLDGTLACPEHRRHFVDPSNNPDYELVSDYDYCNCENNECLPQKWIHIQTRKKFVPDWKSFYESCDKDAPIWPVIRVLNRLILQNEDIQIWAGRCESVREKTIKWLKDYLEIDAWFYRDCLKMRPIGDNTQDDVLKERWLDEYMFGEKCPYSTLEHAVPINKVDFVFDSHPKSIEMWQRRGVFVFNCLQGEYEMLQS